MRNNHRAGGWTQGGEQQCHFCGTQLSWAELQGERDVVAQVEPAQVVSAPLQLLGGRGSCEAWALQLPCSSLLEGSVGSVSGSSGAIPVLCDCTRALLSHTLSPRTKGQDVPAWDLLMGDLSLGWCPKERQCKSTDPFFSLG